MSDKEHFLRDCGCTVVKRDDDEFYISDPCIACTLADSRERKNIDIEIANSQQMNDTFKKLNSLFATEVSRHSQVLDMQRQISIMNTLFDRNSPDRFVGSCEKYHIDSVKAVLESEQLDVVIAEAEDILQKLKNKKRKIKKSNV